MPARLDLLGWVFGRLTVIGEPINEGGGLKWLCRCTCGAEKHVLRAHLTGGYSQSCGCLSAEMSKDRATRHGLVKHPIYSVWTGMLKRCRNPNCADFKDYGGRGIVVCERWADFATFYADMEPTWAKGLTIERDDVNGNYEPGNCRWVPMSEQSRNRRTCVYIDTPRGRMNLAEAARAFGIESTLLRYRIEKGWEPDQWFRAPRVSRVQTTIVA